MKNSLNEAKSGADINILQLLGALWNYSPMFARVFPMDKYDEFSEHIMSMSPSELMQTVGSHPAIVSGFQSAGFFENLGDAGAQSIVSTLSSGQQDGMFAAGRFGGSVMVPKLLAGRRRERELI